MAHTDSSTVERKNKHLNAIERGEIQGLHKQGMGTRAIAIMNKTGSLIVKT